MRLRGRKRIAKNAIVASSVRTIPSVKELHLVGTLCVFADYTAGEDLHLALKHFYSTPVIAHCQVPICKNLQKVWQKHAIIYTIT